MEALGKGGNVGLAPPSGPQTEIPASCQLPPPLEWCRAQGASRVLTPPCERREVPVSQDTGGEAPRGVACREALRESVLHVSVPQVQP